MPIRKFTQGYSLLEMLIVIVLITLLTSIAFPIYSHYIVQQKRLGAIIQLHKMALALEEYAATTNTYEGATFNNLHLPEQIDGYTLKLSLLSINNYEIEAIPEATQNDRDKKCGSLMLNAVGEKNITGKETIENCWN